jgi:D-glycero-D-manno-heptose 1,7-bisphosphate phosphatase
MLGQKAVFLDRDGVLNIPEFREGRSFAPRTLAAFKLAPDAPSSLQRLKDAGFALIVVTNQPDIGKGLLSSEILNRMHDVMRKNLPLDEVEVCPHIREDSCDCRKPKPGMILSSAARMDIDLARSYMVGDRSSDVEAGKAAGCKTIFIDLAYTAEAPPAAPDKVVTSLAGAVDWILDDSVRTDLQ